MFMGRLQKSMSNGKGKGSSSLLKRKKKKNQQEILSIQQWKQYSTIPDWLKQRQDMDGMTDNTRLYFKDSDVYNILSKQ